MYPDNTRRTFLLCCGAATLAGLAGCSGSTDEQTETETDTEGAGDTPAAGGSSCAGLRGDPTSFDTAETPFVFGFDYPATYSTLEPIAAPVGQSQRFESPSVTVDGTTGSATLRVTQFYTARSASAVETFVADRVDNPNSPFAVVGDREYDGETLSVVGATAENSLPLYELHLPYETADDRVYFRTGIEMTSSLVEYDDEGEVRFCLPDLDAAATTVLDSLRPNPETTIADAARL